MSYTLGIVIDNVPLKDKYAKLIACYCMGLDNDETSGTIAYKASTLCNMACDMYDRFGTGASPQSLARKALMKGFDAYGKFKGIEVLDAVERRHLEQLVPRLFCEK